MLELPLGEIHPAPLAVELHAQHGDSGFDRPYSALRVRPVGAVRILQMNPGRPPFIRRLTSGYARSWPYDRIVRHEHPGRRIVFVRGRARPPAAAGQLASSFRRDAEQLTGFGIGEPLAFVSIEHGFRPQLAGRSPYTGRSTACTHRWGKAIAGYQATKTALAHQTGSGQCRAVWRLVILDRNRSKQFCQKLGSRNFSPAGRQAACKRKNFLGRIFPTVGCPKGGAELSPGPARS
jgi:hypothetical protein